jgi:hypothetical protein
VDFLTFSLSIALKEKLLRFEEPRLATSNHFA